MKIELNLKCAYAGCSNHFHIEVESGQPPAAGLTRGRLQQLAVDIGWHWPDESAPLCPEHRQVAGLMECGCLNGAHANHRNMLESAAEREGHVCNLGWPVRL